jgi:predicted metal-binding membrane protein
VLGGLYQLTPFKRACLDHCRSPAEFLARHWRKGGLGAWRLGLVHGAYCLGCCWLLMLLLFVFGVMNLAWIAALAVLVLLEKLVPHGDAVARAAGVLMLGAGLVLGAAAWL